MQYCEKCGVSVAGQRNKCPLCQRVLRAEHAEHEETPWEAGLGSAERFPRVPTVLKKYSLLFRMLLFGSIVAAVVAGIVNVLLPGGGWWALFVAGGIVCMWVILSVAVSKRRNLPQNVLWQVVLVSLLAVGWDAFTGWRGWSLDYVVPILCIAAMVAMAVVAQVLSLRFEDCIIYLLVDALFCIVPTLFLAMQSLHVMLPSLICVGGSVISLAALFLFEGRRMLAELKRRLHL